MNKCPISSRGPRRPACCPSAHRQPCHCSSKPKPVAQLGSTQGLRWLSILQEIGQHRSRGFFTLTSDQLRSHLREVTLKKLGPSKTQIVNRYMFWQTKALPVERLDGNWGIGRQGENSGSWLPQVDP